MPLCPKCCSSQTVKNGRIHNGKQRFKCPECGRQFIENSQKKVIGWAIRELIDRLLLERISLAGIARAVQVSKQWLQSYVNEKYALGTAQRAGDTQKKGKRERFNATSCGRLWTGIGNKQWIWLALDADTREIVGVYIGARDEAAERGVWHSIPPVYPRVYVRKLHTATLDANARSSTPTFGLLTQRFCRTSGIVRWANIRAKRATLSRLNNTLRQRVSRLVRKTLSFSKSLENHIGAIWYFVHYYNASLLV